eukprot:754452-Hanusia_phi.AAC.9
MEEREGRSPVCMKPFIPLAMLFAACSGETLRASGTFSALNGLPLKLAFASHTHRSKTPSTETVRRRLPYMPPRIRPGLPGSEDAMGKEVKAPKTGVEFLLRSSISPRNRRMSYKIGFGTALPSFRRG